MCAFLDRQGRGNTDRRPQRLDSAARVLHHQHGRRIASEVE
jgi:hypothetical protein